MPVKLTELVQGIILPTNITNDTSTNSNNYFPAMTNNQTSGTFSNVVTSSTKLFYNPSTGALNSSSFIPSGSAAPTNGMFLPAANTLGFATNSGERVRITSTGSVGIGTTNPSQTLHVQGTALATGDMRAPIFRLSNDTSSYWQTNEFVLRGTNPTIYFRDTDSNSAMLHCNENLLYVLRGDVDTTTWTAVNGQWPLIINLTNNNATFGGSMQIVTSLGVGTAGSGTTGEIRATNNITAYFSDRRLKTNIKPIDDALAKVMAISGVTFQSNDEAEKYGYADKRVQVGVIAQEIETVLPQVVVPAPFDIKKEPDGTESSKSGENYKTVQYEKLIPLLIEAIKELKAEVDQLKNGTGSTS